MRADPMNPLAPVTSISIARKRSQTAGSSRGGREKRLHSGHFSAAGTKTPRFAGSEDDARGRGWLNGLAMASETDF
jgi:hypothetical protein